MVRSETTDITILSLTASGATQKLRGTLSKTLLRDRPFRILLIELYGQECCASETPLGHKTKMGSSQRPSGMKMSRLTYLCLTPESVNLAEDARRVETANVSTNTVS